MCRTNRGPCGTNLPARPSPAADGPPFLPPAPGPRCRSSANSLAPGGSYRTRGRIPPPRRPPGGTHRMPDAEAADGTRGA